jgi:hypothetical protein
LFLTLDSKSDRRPVAAKNAAEIRSAKPTRNGNRVIRITIGAYTRSKRKLMEPGPNTKNDIASGIPSMFAEIPHSSKNIGSVFGKRPLTM